MWESFLDVLQFFLQQIRLFAVLRIPNEVILFKGILFQVIKAESGSDIKN